MSSATERPSQDFDAALHEIASNLDVRRLMVVVINVLVPACTMSTVSALSGSNHPPALAWFPQNVLWIVGIVLAVGGVFTGAILGRCHFGMVVNGTKLKKVRTGTLDRAPLNLLGVTTNFLVLTALAAAGGVLLIGAVLGALWIGVAVAAATFAGSIAMLFVQHARATRLCATLDATWQHGPVPPALVELHVRKSLDATSADVSVIVTMAAALFAGTFDACCSLGSVAPNAVRGITPADLQAHGTVALMTFTLVSLLLSSRIVVRLRIALAEHAAELARLRAEPDEPWRFRVQERTFLLYLLVALLASVAALIVGWTLAGATVGGAAAALIGLAHVVWYPVRLGRARRVANR